MQFDVGLEDLAKFGLISACEAKGGLAFWGGFEGVEGGICDSCFMLESECFRNAIWLFFFFSFFFLCFFYWCSTLMEFRVAVRRACDFLKDVFVIWCWVWRFGLELIDWGLWNAKGDCILRWIWGSGRWRFLLLFDAGLKVLAPNLIDLSLYTVKGIGFSRLIWEFNGGICEFWKVMKRKISS